MITYKIEGLDAMIVKLRNTGADLPTELLDGAVKKAAQPFAKKLKSEYSQSWGKSKSALSYHMTMQLANSIDTFRRKRRGKNDPFFTYYIGPKYAGTGKNMKKAGNAAHLLEWGTAERFRANTKEGGIGRSLKGKRTGLSSVYGAKYSTGKTPALGIIQRTVDTLKNSVLLSLEKDVFDAILTSWENRGGKFFKK